MSAVREGKNLELLFEATCRNQKLCPVRYHDACKVVRGFRGRPQLVRLPSPFDFIVWRGREAVAVDTKSTGLKSMPMTMIKNHQLIELYRIQEQGGLAGFVIYFRKIERLAFIEASQILILQRAGIKAVQYSDCLDLGSFENELSNDYAKIENIFLLASSDPIASTEA